MEILNRERAINDSIKFTTIGIIEYGVCTYAFARLGVVELPLMPLWFHVAAAYFGGGIVTITRYELQLLARRINGED